MFCHGLGCDMAHGVGTRALCCPVSTVPANLDQNSHFWIPLSMYIVYVMTRLIKDRLCIKMTFMHNDCWVNYYEKCSRHWHICLSINQTHLIFFNTRFYLIFLTNKIFQILLFMCEMRQTTFSAGSGG